MRGSILEHQVRPLILTLPKEAKQSGCKSAKG